MCLNKIKFSIILIIFINFFIFFLLPPLVTPAQAVNDTMPVLQIPIPNLTFSKAVCEPNTEGKTVCSIAWIGEYIAGIYKYAIGIVGILAAVVLMIGGVMWVVAGGSSTVIGEAKSWIGASLTGLIIALCSYLILYQINPALTVFGPLGITQVEKGPTPPSYNEICDWDLTTCHQGTAAEEKKCLTVKPYAERMVYVCCCQPQPLGGDWAYASDAIKAQINDASLELKNLLECLRTNLPTGVGRINSISDSNYSGPNMAQCNVPNCPGNCAHTCQSCHYGGGTKNKSFAVDISTANGTTDAIMTAQNACTNQTKYFKNEGNHIHISAIGCDKN